jgi:hypothetical protein
MTAMARISAALLRKERQNVSSANSFPYWSNPAQSGSPTPCHRVKLMPMFITSGTAITAANSNTAGTR